MKELLELEERHREQLRGANVRGVAVDIARSLIAKPIMTIPEAAKVVGRGYQTVSTAVAKLVELDILLPYGDGHPRRYLAPDVLAVIQRRRS